MALKIFLNHGFKILYTDISCCLINDGFSSIFLIYKQRSKAGRSFIPIYITRENFSNSYKIKWTKIRGIRIDDTGFKISQLSDDTTCFLSNEKSGF